jgi:DNA-binding transcriptional ArsR family regulator
VAGSEDAVSGQIARSTRDFVLQAIRVRPGVSMSDVARAAGMSWAATALHVDQLTAEGLVRSARVGRRRVLFVAPADGADALARGLLAEPACLRVARAIVAHPRLPVYELSFVAGMSERAVYHHLKRLLDAGLVEGRRGYRGLRATPALLSLLAEDG